MAMRACSGRIAVVGDDRQAIYGFRGADSNSLDRLKKELGALELGLTTTYRCPKRIVALAAKLVPDFAADASAPDGDVSEIALERLPDMATPGDFVLSRANAPLAGACMRLIRAGVPARIEGKDIGQSLTAIVRKLTKRGPFDSVADIENRLTNWQEKEEARIDRSAGDMSETAIEMLNDKCETLRAIIDGISSVPELEQRLVTMFADNGDSLVTRHVVCSSVHKAKGLEADRVFVMRDTLNNKKGNAAEEQNIEYVAITRAKRELVWVTGK
jgi:DNA helicase-2/ATP-dependent DNA helicase PcrA